MPSQAYVSETSVDLLLLVQNASITDPDMAASLTAQGFRVIEARTGAKAIDLIRQHRGTIEWLVTNYSLSDGVSGSHIAFEFRYLNPTRPIVFLAERELPFEVRRMGGVEILTPPFDKDVLSALMSSLRNSIAAGTLGL